MIAFKVYDKQTGELADINKIALTEDWAKELRYCDVREFALDQDGLLILLDACGNYTYIPADQVNRFEIFLEDI